MRRSEASGMNTDMVNWGTWIGIHQSENTNLASSIYKYIHIDIHFVCSRYAGRLQ